jgi:hypothetical protein
VSASEGTGRGEALVEATRRLLRALAVWSDLAGDVDAEATYLELAHVIDEAGALTFAGAFVDLEPALAERVVPGLGALVGGAR